MAIADERLAQFIERIESLTEQKRSFQNDINEVFAEAKGVGFDIKAMRAIIRERAQDADALREFNEILDTYRQALGHLADTPLGGAVIRKVTTERARKRKNGHGEAHA